MSLTAEQLEQILPVKIAVENKLIALPGVTGVDIALKKVAGQETDTPCILIFVAKKGVFAEGECIPERIAGVATDIEEGVFEHLLGTPGRVGTDEARYDPCQGGANVAPARFNNYYGTVGALVTDTASGAKVWLSAYHVLCNDPGWSNPGVDRNVTQPALCFGGTEAANTIGGVLRGTYGQVDVPWGYDLYIDAAVCSSSGRATNPNVIHVGAPRGAANASYNALVTKYGATTNRTTGVVVSTNFTVNIGGTTFYYQYRIGPPFPGGQAFSQPGDSGAAVFDSDFNLVGLVIAGNGTYSTVNPIGQIIDALNISVP